VDLTYQCTFYDIEKGEIVDLVGGIIDIKMVLLERLV
jgi:tRNA nucleotidyltransferase/poly(A) polymerase